MEVYGTRGVELAQKKTVVQNSSSSYFHVSYNVECSLFPILEVSKDATAPRGHARRLIALRRCRSQSGRV